MASGCLFQGGPESKEASLPFKWGSSGWPREWSQVVGGPRVGGLAAWVLGRARQKEGRRERGVCPRAGVPWGNNEAFGDGARPTPSFPACPLCGLDPGGCVGAGRGALNGPLVSVLGVGQAPGHAAPSPGLARSLASTPSGQWPGPSLPACAQARVPIGREMRPI